MITMLSSLIAFLVTIPLLGFILTYIVFKKITNNPRKSVHRALDYTTIFFIAAVHFLILTIWGRSFFWLISLFIILIAMIFVIIHWKIKGEIVLSIVFRGFWRFNFMVFFLAYVVLTFFGLFQRLLQTF